MKRILILIYFNITCYLCLLAQERVIIVSIEGDRPLDRLSCTLNLNYLDKKKYQASPNQAKDIWHFHIPDSIFEQYCQIHFGGYNESDSCNMDLSFKIVNEKDTTLYTSGCMFWENNDSVSLNIEFIKQDTISITRSYGTRTYIGRNYLIKNPSAELERSIVNINNHHMKYRNESIDNFVKRYQKMIIDAPDSRSSMVRIYEARSILNYHQLEQLYSLFSKVNQQSFHGQKLNGFLKIQKEKFSDTLLENSVTGKRENIILNDSTYTLVLFSASWCAPCHALIPVLKELYQNYREKLDIVYVSLDEPSTQKSWIKLLEEKQIPWRALSTGNRVTEIREKYSIPSIPFSYLISPNKEVEQIDIRDKEGLAKIQNLK